MPIENWVRTELLKLMGHVRSTYKQEMPCVIGSIRSDEDLCCVCCVGWELGGKGNRVGIVTRTPIMFSLKTRVAQ